VYKNTKYILQKQTSKIKQSAIQLATSYFFKKLKSRSTNKQILNLTIFSCNPSPLRSPHRFSPFSSSSHRSSPFGFNHRPSATQGCGGGLTTPSHHLPLPSTSSITTDEKSPKSSQTLTSTCGVVAIATLIHRPRAVAVPPPPPACSRLCHYLRSPLLLHPTHSPKSDMMIA
jgi:hypothetical protein